MIKVTDAIPTVREELERKIVDVLTDLVHGENTRRLSQGELKRTAKLLWTVTAGLVSDEVSSLCAQAAGPDEKHLLQRRFLGKGEVLTVFWLADAPGYIVRSTNATTLKTVELMRRKTEVDARAPELEKLFTSLPAKGYVELK